ncbi:hypothetical protein AVEN_21241-1 [Araneus ventricosus]|uniref:Uncharacterized protein n=1 Tax=Araneus ventricosus TaxID=182803 RepID=A0A4Y2GJB2_ARAVE|nr:hypothetical protein AVEN_21241-1 [Araneus ventricosus]
MSSLILQRGPASQSWKNYKTGQSGRSPFVIASLANRSGHSFAQMTDVNFNPIRLSAFMSWLSRWSDGYTDCLDIQPSFPIRPDNRFRLGVDAQPTLTAWTRLGLLDELQNQ